MGGPNPHGEAAKPVLKDQTLLLILWNSSEFRWIYFFVATPKKDRKVGFLENIGKVNI
jgi:hypothetical protein